MKNKNGELCINGDKCIKCGSDLLSYYKGEYECLDCGEVFLYTPKYDHDEEYDENYEEDYEQMIKDNSFDSFVDLSEYYVDYGCFNDCEDFDYNGDNDEED